MSASPYPPSVTALLLTEDADHYYVTIDRDQRERAKGIVGRIWNPEIRKWVYPRTNEVYRALVGEFSDQPQSIRLTPPAGFTAAPAQPVSSAAPNPAAQILPHPVASVAPTAAVAKLTALEELLREQLRLTARVQERLTCLETAIAAFAAGRAADSAPNTSDVVRAILDGFEQRLAALLPSSSPGAVPIKSQDDHVGDWLMTQVVGGAGDHPTIVDVCSHWHLARDYRSVVDDLEEKLKERLREILDLGPSCRKSLHELINDGFESKALNKEQSKLLGAFRHHRNTLAHESREPAPRKYLRYLHALSAVALVWPELGKNPTPDREDEAATNRSDPAPAKVFSFDGRFDRDDSLGKSPAFPQQPTDQKAEAKFSGNRNSV